MSHNRVAPAVASLRRIAAALVKEQSSEVTAMMPALESLSGKGDWRTFWEKHGDDPQRRLILVSRETPLYGKGASYDRIFNQLADAVFARYTDAKGNLLPGIADLDVASYSGNRARLEIDITFTPAKARP